MLETEISRNSQRPADLCLGKHTDGVLGRLIDLLAVFALLAGTATTFSVATPLMASIIKIAFHVELSRITLSIIILLITMCDLHILTFARVQGHQHPGKNMHLPILWTTRLRAIRRGARQDILSILV